ncbi:DUF1178 family protein [Sphingosinicella microcystinivorans]|uniref:DUF1178 family protein n=1 Tax=Sphingosinicella microcystinivorans TaxID=335406 RepID=A0AAD1G050_SPHMI|nr:DUF1178 family protein [Sphingosinicella microcystinivorans]RKS90623.1 hypothetical protein DFR51_0162 [Sphingosinicella microcystinivorans]BBE33537.1 hypothetical protein SmB9_11950 [Sphingosinicella microcystinivorans]
MIVFDLKCGEAHVFEAWFGSTSDYETQKERGLLACPLCSNTEITKAVMAPAVPAKGNMRDETRPVPVAGGEDARIKQMLGALAEMQKSMIESSEYVGNRFAEEARAIHYGETDARGIYGETSADEAAQLRDEGIEAMPLLFPTRPGGTDA